MELGYLPERKVMTPAGKVSGPYQRLISTGKLLQEYGADVAPHGVVDKDHLPVNPGNAQPLGGVAGDGHGMELVFL